MQAAYTPVVQPPKLLDQVHDRIRVKHYSIRTETQILKFFRGRTATAEWHADLIFFVSLPPEGPFHLRKNRYLISVVSG